MIYLDFPRGSEVNNPPAIQGDVEPRGPRGQEDALEEEMAAHSNNLAQNTPRTGEPGGLQSMELQKSHIQLMTKQQQWLI